MASSSRYAVSSVEGKTTYHRTKPGANKEYTRRYHRGDLEITIDDLQTGERVKRSTSKIVSPSRRGSYTFSGGEYKRNPMDLAQEAFAAGKDWWHHGQHSSGVANARVVRYGFLKWWNNHTPAATQGHSKAKGGKLERAFREGWVRGKNETMRNPRSRKNPKANYIVFPDGKGQGVPEFFSSTLAAKRYAGPLANKLGHGVFVYKENLRTGLMQQVDMVAPYSKSRSRNPGGPLDTHAAKELELFVENDGDLHRQQGAPINKNLITKMARGVYNHAGAVKLFGYLMESGAKKYIKQHGSVHAYTGRDEWHQVFSPATRKAAAEAFAKHFEVEAKLGNYDHLLPKKYSGWRVPNGKLVDVRVKRNGRVFNAKARKVNGKLKVYVTPDVARKVNPGATRFRVMAGPGIALHAPTLKGAQKIVRGLISRGLVWGRLVTIYDEDLKKIVWEKEY